MLFIFDSLLLTLATFEFIAVVKKEEGAEPPRKKPRPTREERMKQRVARGGGGGSVGGVAREATEVSNGRNGTASSSSRGCLEVELASPCDNATRKINSTASKGGSGILAGETELVEEDELEEWQVVVKADSLYNTVECGQGKYSILIRTGSRSCGHSK